MNRQRYLATWFTTYYLQRTTLIYLLAIGDLSRRIKHHCFTVFIGNISARGSQLGTALGTAEGGVRAISGL